MKMRPLASLIFLGALSFPTLAIATTPALAAETATSQVAPAPAPGQPGHQDHGDDRPRIEEHHEGLQGAELFILGGAFVAALGIAYRVGKVSTSRKTKASE